MTDAPEPQSTTDTPDRRAPHWMVVLIGAAIVGLIIANNIGNAYFSRWIEDHPLRLISLNASNKFLLLTANQVEFWAFMVVPSIRLLAPDPLFFALGAIYRDRALHWAQRVFPGLEPLFAQVRSGEGTATTVMRVLVFIAPNNPVCLAAGAMGMPVRTFALLNITGTLARVLLFNRLAWLLSDQVDAIASAITRYQGYIFPISLALVVGYLIWQFTGKRGLVGGVETLAEELEDGDGQG